MEDRELYKLIIVDDENGILEGISNLFPWNNIGFEIEATFSSGKKVLEYVKTHKVDVVMSDIKMPDMDGITLVRKLKECFDIKIVLFSNYQNFEYCRSALRYHIEDYLLKPVAYEELVNCFAKIKKNLDKERNVAKVEMPKNYYDKIIETVTDYLLKNYKDASLEKAAALVNLSTNYLSKVFKEKSGSGFAEHLLKIRMEKACEFLKDIRYKSYEIAYLIGYDNPKNFSRAFKSYYQISPTEYRNKKIEDN